MGGGGHRGPFNIIDAVGIVLLLFYLFVANK
jgi:hypothetical protein